MYNLYLPGSKSLCNRAVCLAGMSNFPVYLQNFLQADDTLGGLDALKTLGFQIHSTPSTLNSSALDVLITRCHSRAGGNPCVLGLDSRLRGNDSNGTQDDKIININSAGTLARFFPSVILNWSQVFNQPPIQVKLDASAQLKKRPITPLIQALQNLGAQIEGTTYPFTITSSHLSGSVTIDTTNSSQFLSGLLLARYGAKNKFQIVQQNTLPQKGYVEMTKKMIQNFEEHNNKSQNSQFLFSIEPDASTACYFLALAFLHNKEICIQGLGTKSLQPDVEFCDFLIKMGANIKVEDNQIKIFKRKNQKFNGGFDYDFSAISDQALTAACLAIFADTPITIGGVSHIRFHESDRIAGLAKNFTQLGFTFKEHKDGFTIFPVQKENFSLANGIWHTFDDHRFAMSGFLLSSLNARIAINNKLCVGKTAPYFFKHEWVLALENEFHHTPHHLYA